ncbi:MAG: LCP family protein [Clostridiales bacterium]
MIALLKSKKNKALVLLAVLALLVLTFYVWQNWYFTLPEGEKKPGIDGEEAPAVLAGIDKFDILLLGLDSREGEPGLGQRSDTILLVTLDTKENLARILTIPRDTRVKYKGGWHKINEVYNYDGAEGSVQAVEDLLDTSIDRYAVVDFAGVIHLVDLMDGVDVNVPKDMRKPLEGINLKKGPQHLNGTDALAYMRYRDGTLSDMDRSERQKEVLIQLAEKILQPSNLLKLPSMANTALSYMKTDISTQEIVALAKHGKAILGNGIENQVLPGSNEYYNGGWYFVPYLEELGLPMGEAEKEFRRIMSQKAAEEKAAAEKAAEEEAAKGEENPENQESQGNQGGQGNLGNQGEPGNQGNQGNEPPTESQGNPPNPPGAEQPTGPDGPTVPDDAAGPDGSGQPGASDGSGAAGEEQQEPTAPEQEAGPEAAAGSQEPAGAGTDGTGGMPEEPAA